MYKKILNLFLAATLLSFLFSSHAVTSELTDKPPAVSGDNPVNIWEKKPPIEAKLLDVLLIRPFSLATSVITTGICIATLPFTFPVGVSQESARVLIEAPWRFTAGRCLGTMHYKDEKPITALEECVYYDDNTMRVSSGKIERRDINTTHTPELVTFNGYHAESNKLVHEIYLWRELNNPLAGVNATARHDEQALLVKQEGERVFVVTSGGRRGWTKKEFIREFK